jgi:RNA polymerase sigma-70 factor (ECF subfamily)
MLLNAARLATRTDPTGNILRLQDQDRSAWDRALIARGLQHLARSAAGDVISAYHLQAGIAACHCTAPDFESTDWPRILSLYDRLVEIDDSPVVALNRAVAAAQLHGPQVGLDTLDRIPRSDVLDSYYLLHAVRAEFESQLQRHGSAAVHLRKALQLADLKSEQSLLSQRLAAVEQEYRESYPGQ